MAANPTAIKNAVQSFDFDRLFREELGWNRARGPLSLPVDGTMHTLERIAEKGEIPVLLHVTPSGQKMPDKATRAKILRQLRKLHLWNVVIFFDEERTTQVWQWERREPGKPIRAREIVYSGGSKERALLQVLPNLDFPLELEDDLGHLDVVSRLEDASRNAERVTRKFYDRFQKEHSAFVTFISGIPAGKDGDLHWYASLMLNRLMFVYFIQKKGFLDNDVNYLHNRLDRLRDQHRHDEFYSFYRTFLICLFHQGLNAAVADRPAHVTELIGQVPYLNGGFFEEHQLEQQYPDIQIPDEAFERLFAFFDDYQWHLDERPTESDNEINPDVLGYIFEKYINQKQMGAYYTKEDITEYIGKNTIIPWILETVFADPTVTKGQRQNAWDLLAEAPDRYIYPAILKGVDLPLPPDIERGVANVSDREGWNRPASDEFALPTETWREHIARRQRCLEVRAKLRHGEVRDVNGLITLNLNIGQFAQDVIAFCESPRLLKALYKTINTIAVLDPTCGSGAFLFAALNILEPLYERCLLQADVLSVELAELTGTGENGSELNHEQARDTVDRRRRYGIYKSIILSNLYGVDIMEEAVEICKLRLFLKLVSQLEPSDQIDPLPDIDFNIRSGNTLVGYATRDSVERALTQQSVGTASDHCEGITARVAVAQATMDITGERQAVLDKFLEDAETVDLAYQRFHEMQVEYGASAEEVRATKLELGKRLDLLRNQLNQCLSFENGVAASGVEFERWREKHQPFHWFVEFHDIMNRGGFDTIVGNPPYVELSKLKGQYSVIGYATWRCGNLYALVTERVLALVSPAGRTGLILPMSLVSTSRMAELRELVFTHSCWISSFDMRPNSLFEGVAQRLCIIVTAEPSDRGPHVWAGGYRRWSAAEREALLPTTRFVSTDRGDGRRRPLPKLSEPLEVSILNRFSGSPLSNFIDEQSSPIYVHRIVRYYLKALDFLPLFVDPTGEVGKSEDYKEFLFHEQFRLAITAQLNSTLAYWFWRCHSDGFHCGYGDVYAMPFAPPTDEQIKHELSCLQATLSEHLKSNSKEKSISTKNGSVRYQEFKMPRSKPVLDEIDRTLAKNYGFTDEELDFIINYDIKYRMGRDAGGGEDAA